MQKTIPTFGRLAAIILFSLSCFGILLFVWISFGGPTPLAPQEYRFTASFEEANNVVQETDVRISGVPVGNVKAVDLSDDGRADVTIGLEPRYAPIAKDTKAILRQKTLLGEIYIELTPGSPDAPTLDEGEDLAVANVADSVQLDEIFRSFDTRTRNAFQQWLEQQAVGIDGRGSDLSAALGTLPQFTEETDRLVRLLLTQRDATTQLVRNTGEVFGALAERQGQLQGLITNANQVFATTARRNTDLKEAFVAFPTFLEESRRTLTRLESFARQTDPLVTQLRPAARALTPVSKDVEELAPELNRFFTGLNNVQRDSKAGLPALQKLLTEDFPPLLGQLDPALRNLNPVIEGLGFFDRELAALLGNATAVTQAVAPEATLGNQTKHYLRTTTPLNPEVVAAYPRRVATNRTLAYAFPGVYASLATGLPVYETASCTQGLNVSLPTQPGGGVDQELLDLINQFAFVGQPSTATVPRPGCTKQPQFPQLGVPGPSTDYPHVLEEPAAP